MNINAGKTTGDTAKEAHSGDGVSRDLRHAPRPQPDPRRSFAIV
jgi:hypothetical protein